MGTWAVVDERGVVLAVFHCTPERAEQRAARLEGAAGVRDITQADPQPGLGWRYDRETREWTE